MQLSFFDILQPKIELKKRHCIELGEIFEAYYSCRANKRNTANAIAFVVDKPVTREIFAADFRDRVVHHLIIGKLNHLFEK